MEKYPEHAFRESVPPPYLNFISTVNKKSKSGSQ